MSHVTLFQGPRLCLPVICRLELALLGQQENDTHCKDGGAGTPVGGDVLGPPPAAARRSSSRPVLLSTHGWERDPSFPQAAPHLLIINAILHSDQIDQELLNQPHQRVHFPF